MTVRVSGSLTRSAVLACAAAALLGAAPAQAKDAPKPEAPGTRPAASKPSTAPAPKTSAPAPGQPGPANGSKPAAPAGGITRKQLTEAYGGAISYFNKQIPASQARKLADSVIDASVKHGVDARLIIAALAQEGVFEHAAAGKDGLTFKKRPASDVVESTSRDLAARVQEQSGKGTPDDAVRRALADRGAKALYPRDRGGALAREYARGAFQLYRHLCGAEGEPPSSKPAAANAGRKPVTKAPAGKPQAPPSGVSIE